MPSGATAEGRAQTRARVHDRILEIIAAGGPRPSSPAHHPSLDWYAAQLEPRTFEEVADELQHIGTVEALVGSAATTQGGGMTVQLQVLPAYAHEALDMCQRSLQGVLVCVLFQAPWELFADEDKPGWAHLSMDPDDMDVDGD